MSSNTSNRDGRRKNANKIHEYTCRACGRQAQLRFPRKGKLISLNLRCDCGVKLEKNRPIGIDSKKWYHSLKFRASSVERFLDLKEITQKNGFRQTDESLEVAKQFVNRLQLTRPWGLSILPHCLSNKLSASALKSKHDVLRRLRETSPGKLIFTKPGSNSDKGECIDAAICSSINFSKISDNISMATRVIVPIESWGVTVTGTPDFNAFGTIPSEVKSVENFDEESLFRMPDYRSQIGVYQSSNEHNRGFLIILSRDTGHVVGLEADPNNPSLLQNKFSSWFSDKDFRSEIENYREKITIGGE